jgi:hypoxanthine phosphoribosyltransferase
VGIKEGGLIPANLLALYLNRPFSDLNSFLKGHIYKAGERGSFFTHNENKRVLIVDDCLRTGETLRKARLELEQLSDRFQFSYCVVYIEPGKESEVDYFFDHMESPQYMQWHMMASGIREKIIFDNQKTPVYTEWGDFPFLFSPTTIQAQAAFRKTGKAVLSLSDFEMVNSTNTMWKDIKSGKFMPGFRNFIIQSRNFIRRTIKKIRK